MSRPMSFTSSWMKMLLSRSRLRIGQLKREIIKQKTAFANIDSNSLDLCRGKILHANKVDLTARVKAQTLNSPLLLSESFTFPIGPKADTVHVSVKPAIRLTFSLKGGTPIAAGSVQKRKPRHPVAVISELTARRESTVRALYDRLNRYRFVLVRGTPASGKSTLAQLLADHIHSEEPAVDPIMINGWVRSKGHWSSRLPEYNEGPHTFIINEAQLTYWDSGLWNSFLKPIGALDSPHRAILFASYGSPDGRVTAEGTSMYVPDRNQVSSQPVDHGDQITPAGLFYTRAEFADVVERRYPSGLFEQNFLDYVFRVTAGHPGAVTDLLRIVTNHASYRNVKDEDNKYSLEIFHSEFPIERLWSCLDDGSIFRRGLPMLEEFLDPGIARVFRAVLTNDSVTEKKLDSTEDRDALHLCFKYGWLHAAELQDKTVYIFATPLHRWFVEYYLGARVAKYTPIAGQDLPAFAIEVIRNFSRFNLPFGEQIGALDRRRLPEAQYQGEFYRCCHKYTNGSLYSFPNFGNASGEIDLYIPGGKWGVELLRDGEILENHSSRFVGKGAYAKMEFNDYIILDFRTTQPQSGHPKIPNLYHVVFNDDYRFVRILKGSSLELITEFELLNA